MSVITKLEAFKWRSLPSDTTQPLHAFDGYTCTFQASTFHPLL